MKNLKFTLLFVLGAILFSCGPSPDDYSTEEIKSECDCLKMRTEVTKHSNNLLENEDDLAKRKEIQESDDYKQWSKKDHEIHLFCHKNYKSYFSNEKCEEFKTFHEELDKNRKLYQGGMD